MMCDHAAEVAANHDKWAAARHAAVRWVSERPLLTAECRCGYTAHGEFLDAYGAFFYHLATAR